MSVRVLAFLLCLPATALAGQSADAILRDLGLAGAAEIVQVDAARQPDGSVAVRLQPTGDARLVADPGVTVVPVDPAGSPVAAPVELVDRSREYFDMPPVLQVLPGAATALRVEYAYCVIEKQCLFGEAVVAVPPGS